jgi:hypothetical protein
VKVFKTTIKTSGEMVNEEITNLFNFTFTNCHGHENNQIYGILKTKMRTRVGLIPNPNHEIITIKKMTSKKQNFNRILLQ